MLTWCPIILLETETDFIDDGFNASIYNWFSLIFNEYDFSDYNDPDCISLRPFFLVPNNAPQFPTSSHSTFSAICRRWQFVLRMNCWNRCLWPFMLVCFHVWPVHLCTILTVFLFSYDSDVLCLPVHLCCLTILVAFLVNWETIYSFVKLVIMRYSRSPVAGSFTEAV